MSPLRYLFVTSSNVNILLFMIHKTLVVHEGKTYLVELFFEKRDGALTISVLLVKQVSIMGD